MARKGAAQRAPSVATAKARAMGWSIVGQGAARAPQAGTPDRGNVAAPGEGSVLGVFAASRQLAQDVDPFGGLYRTRVVVSPPYNPDLLLAHVEESDVLPVAVEAMATNISGFGFDLEPLFETEAETGDEGGNEGEGEEGGIPPEALAERERLDLFFAACAIGLGVEGVLETCDREIEQIGYGGFEVLRDAEGNEAAFEPLPGRQLRFARRSDLVPVEVPVRHPATGALVRLRRFRRFRACAQIDEAGQVVWFKAYGDPRHLNATTGEYRDWKVETDGSLEVGEPWGDDGEGGALDATEYVARLCVPRSGSPYGVPRWIGASPHVVAGRRAAELPAYFLEHAPIGLLVAMVAGGSWKAGSLEKIVDAIKRRKGLRGAFEVVGLEAETNPALDITDESSSSSPKVSIETMTGTLDSTFFAGQDSLVGMTKRHVRQMFRLGAIYYGDSEAETNRAAADVAFQAGEEQVFVPIRKARWERFFNDELFPAMGITFWRFRLRGRPFASAEDATAAVGALDKAGGLTPNSAAALYASLTGSEAYAWNDPWADRPLAIGLALLQQGIDPSTPLDEAAAVIAARLEAISAPLVDPAADPAGAADPDEEVALPSGAVLNGAQVNAALDIATAVATGTLPEQNARAMLVGFLGLDDATAASVLVDLAGKAPRVKPPEQNVTADPAEEPEADPAAEPAVDSEDDPEIDPEEDATASKVLDEVRKAATAVGLASLRARIATSLQDDDVVRLPDNWRSRG